MYVSILPMTDERLIQFREIQIFICSDVFSKIEKMDTIIKRNSEEMKFFRYMVVQIENEYKQYIML